CGFYAFGDYDLCFISEGPDNQSMASALIAAVAGGAISKMHTTVLMTPEEGLEAIKAAGSVEYRPPGS
ncbi:MAG: GYD domain-containing protein, partial [SAR324 cluster bacterium]|nr:GYD domain-containing protein [SAR324 cluster bacterium]